MTAERECNTQGTYCSTQCTLARLQWRHGPSRSQHSTAHSHPRDSNPNLDCFSPQLPHVFCSQHRVRSPPPRAPLRSWRTTASSPPTAAQMMAGYARGGGERPQQKVRGMSAEAYSIWAAIGWSEAVVLSMCEGAHGGDQLSRNVRSVNGAGTRMKQGGE